MPEPTRRRPLQLWDRQSGESAEAHRAFIAYRDLGPRRSLDALAAYLATGRRDGGKKAAPGHLSRWSKAHEWVARADAWDAHLLAQRDREAAKAAALWERRRQAELEDAWKAAGRLRKRARAMLQFSHVRQEITREEKDDAGRVIVQHITQEPVGWTFRDAIAAIRCAAELRAAVLAARDKDPADMSDAELAAVGGAAT